MEGSEGGREGKLEIGGDGEPSAGFTVDEKKGNVWSRLLLE